MSQKYSAAGVSGRPVRCTMQMAGAFRCSATLMCCSDWRKAATCAHCHGTNGKAVDGSTVPSLAGLGKAYQIEQMKAFKAGTRSATIMHQISKGYSDAQIEALATYFSAQKK